MFVHLNGRLYDETETPLSPFNRGLLLGEGVFETLRTYGGNPFAVQRHLIRLRQGAAKLGFPALPTDEFFRNAISEVIRSNDLDNARVRITVTGGDGPLGPQRANEELTVLVTGGKLGGITPAAHLGVAPWNLSTKSALTGIKSTSYGEHVMSLNWATDQGLQEAVLLNEFNNLCEATSSNIFVVLDGQLLTPPLAAGCLPGIIRELLIESMEIVEHDISINQLRYIEEAFLTSSLREVQPVASIDGHMLRINGAYSEKAISTLKSIIAATPDP